jgi:hypothetical protein
MTHLVNFFTSIDYGRLRPAPEVLAVQPGNADPARFISAARTDRKDLMVFYVPVDRVVEVKLDALTTMTGSPNITWVNPRTGERRAAVALLLANSCQVPTPDAGDWILLVTAGPAGQ